jgi:N-acetylmuramic acid 6-phosphate etherase
MSNITESASNFNNLEQMSVKELLTNINKEDQTIASAVQQALPQVEVLVSAIEERMQQGGRLFYIGAGTSGRLGILDASECPPTYGVPYGLIVGVIAGGETAIQEAVEFAEDDTEQAWKDLQAHRINALDSVVGIAASGRTPYVVAGIRKCIEEGILTGCITCNPNSELAALAECPIEVIVGPEFVTGSTRMKAGTAQKMVLNMISTALMIRMGNVKGSKMVNMQLSNHKLVDRGVRMIIEELAVTYDEAAALLNQWGNVKAAIENYKA